MQKKEMSRLEGHLLFGIQAHALMMEQADSGKCHNHIVCVAGIDNILVAFGAAWLCHVCYAAAVSTLDIVTEWEKGVGTKRDARISGKPFPFFLCGKYRRFYFKRMLPYILSQHVHIIFPDIEVNGVIAVSALDIVLELQAEHLRGLAQIPVVCFCPGQPRAVNAGLLPGSDADCLAALYIADRIGLGIF